MRTAGGTVGGSADSRVSFLVGRREGGRHYCGGGQRWRGPHVVPGLWTAWPLVVAVGFAPHPMGPPGGVHRQARAV